MKKNIEVDKDEILKFEAMASEWWILTVNSSPYTCSILAD